MKKRSRVRIKQKSRRRLDATCGQYKVVASSPPALVNSSQISFWVVRGLTNEGVEIGFPSRVADRRMRRIVRAIEEVVWTELVRGRST